MATLISGNSVKITKYGNTFGQDEEYTCCD
jgi:hypothetical protein